VTHTNRHSLRVPAPQFTGDDDAYVDTDPQRLAVADNVGATAVESGFDRRFGRYPVTVDHTSQVEGRCDPQHRAGGTCTSTAIYFDPHTPMPLLEMYTRGLTFRTGRVNARALMPSVLELVTAGRLRPEVVTSSVVAWDEAAESLPERGYKTVVTRGN